MPDESTSPRRPTSKFGELLDREVQDGVGEAVEGRADLEVESVKMEDDEMETKRAFPPRVHDAAMNAPWTQVAPPITNSPGQRSAETYRDVIDQFDVQHSYPGRYRPGDHTDDTRCNIFAGDVMRAMGTPLPTKGDLGVGHGESVHSDPMTANAKDTYNWLTSETAGWRRVDVNSAEDLEVLREHLKAGKPAIASDPGHIAVLRPDHVPGPLTKDSLGNLRIAQAGKYNHNDIELREAGYESRFTPAFFIHE